MKQQPRRPGAVALQGHRAGFASRATAAAIDLAVITLLELGCLLFAALVRYLVVGPPFGAPTLPRWLSAAAAVGIAVAYLAAGWATVGRTVGMQALGLRLLGRSGRPPRLAAALLRAVLCLAVPAGLLWTLVSRRNASIQDLVLRTAVVYDWSYGPPVSPKSPPADEARPRRISQAGRQRTARPPSAAPPLPGGRDESTRIG
jgi:uncharacterized RDD family membrane protein YckC